MRLLLYITFRILINNISRILHIYPLYQYATRHTKYVYTYPTHKFTSIRLTDAYHWDDNDAFTFPQLKLCGAWRVGYDDEHRALYNV